MRWWLGSSRATLHYVKLRFTTQTLHLDTLHYSEMILTVAMIQTVIAIAHQFSKMAPKKAAYSENQDTVL